MADVFLAETPTQIEHVRSLFRAYYAELTPQYRPQNSESEIAALPYPYVAPQGALLLAAVAGQPAGCVGLRPFPLDGACEMKRLYVRPAFRGDKLGRELVERIIGEAKVLGYRRMRLDTHPPTMASALKLYRHVGFEQITPEPSEAIEGLIYMEKIL